VQNRQAQEALEPVIAAFCELRGFVLDPFCGSTLVAARRIGRTFIGVKRDQLMTAAAGRSLQSAPHALHDVASSGLSTSSTGNDTGPLTLSDGVGGLRRHFFLRCNVAAIIIPFRGNHESARSIASSFTRH
jgi:hypothetical protein